VLFLNDTLNGARGSAMIQFTDKFMVVRVTLVSGLREGPKRDSSTAWRDSFARANE